MPTARQLTEQRMRELVSAPVASLADLEDAPVEVEIETDHGARYRMKTHAFWDTEPWESDLYVRVKTTGRGLRFFERYYGVETRGPERNFEPLDDDVAALVSPTWTEVVAWAGCLACVLVFLVGLVFLASLFL